MRSVGVGPGWVIAGVLVAGTVVAQGPRERPRVVLQALDLDHDGALSAAELREASASLRSLDRDGSGQLTADEMEAPRADAGAAQDQLVTQMMSLDKNGDGALTADEMPERMRGLFARGDTNGDGRLTPEEIRHAAAHTGRPNGRAAGAGKAGGMMRLDPVLNTLDADHDGVLSTSEMQGAPAALAALDADHDGVVEAAEMRVRQPTPEERTAHVLDEFDTNHDGRLSQDEVPDGMRPRFPSADADHDGVLDHDELLQMFAAMQSQTNGDSHTDAASAATQVKGQQK